MTVTALPSAPTATGTTVCAGNTATLTAVAAAGTLTWYADPSGAVSVGTGPSFTSSVLNQTTAFYVRESSASGCLSPLTQVTATVNSLPTAPAGSASAVCAGSSVILNGFGSGGTLNWFNVATGGTSLGSGITFNAGILTAGTYTFYVEENNGNCSSARTPVAVTVNAAPAAPTPPEPPEAPKNTKAPSIRDPKTGRAMRNPDYVSTKSETPKAPRPRTPKK